MSPEDFIARWTNREGGAERANYVMFLTELCEVIGVGKPDPAGATRDYNDYVFERAVRPRESADISAPQRIDLYKKGCFVLEAKQSRLPGKAKAVREMPGQGKLALDEPERLGRRSVSKGWDVMMQNARKQGETYVFLLETSQPSPPFLIVCDVGHCFELYADFSGTGRAYSQFPDRKGFRIYLEDLRKAETREFLHKVWTDPQSLDPTKHAAAVTREIAKRLAEVSKRLEARGSNPEDVAHFLMRCLFTMFAEDVELLPKASFQTLLQESIEDPTHFAYRLKSLWKQMDEGEHYSFVIKDKVRKFNGGLFKNTTAFDLDKEEIGELYAAAKHDWKAVDPAIFGTLLEQALDPKERRKLGAHYTPRAYVQRLVDVTIMEPLRDDWRKALTKAERAQNDGDEKKAVGIVRAFHHQLCTTRVLDPACGTGNFLYVSLELMKRLEGEVLETLAELGEPESMGLDRETVDPHQFLGLELNPRAAAIAELVVWIGYLQQHYRTRNGHPGEPILRDFKNINSGQRVGYDSILNFGTATGNEGSEPGSDRPCWPKAAFIVGNPPFISNRDMRGLFGDEYVDRLKPNYPEFVQAADYVLFFWIRAAAQLNVRNIGFVSTSRIRLPQNNSVLKKALGSKWRIRFAIPDHPWLVDGSGAQVRVSFITVDAARVGPCVLLKSADHDRVNIKGTSQPEPYQTYTTGYINLDLTVGASAKESHELSIVEGLCSAGVKPYSQGFLVQRAVRDRLFDTEYARDLRAPVFMNGHDVGQHWRGYYIIDVNDMNLKELRDSFPKAYTHILEHVRPARKSERNPRLREEFWKFEANRQEMRQGLKGLRRFIATLENSPQRYFVFVASSVLPDQKLRVLASDDAWALAVLSSKAHLTFSLKVGGRAGVANTPVYNTDCVVKFPFPDRGLREHELRTLGEELDANRKGVQTENPDLTLTGLYNVLEKIKVSAFLTDKEEDIKQRGLVLILKELHDEIDRLTAEAYGWPSDLSDEETLARLVALNAERAKEEAAGHVRWLRPDYQIPRFGKKVAAKTGELDLAETVVAVDAGKPAFPAEPGEATLAIEALLAASGHPMSAADIARGFKKGGKRIEQKVIRGLASLVLYGRVSAVGADQFVARRAA